MVKWLPLLALAACPQPTGPWDVEVAPPDGQDAILAAAEDVAADMDCNPSWRGHVSWVPLPFYCGDMLAAGCSPPAPTNMADPRVEAKVVYAPRAEDTALAYELGHFVSASCGLGWRDLGPELDAWAAQVNAEARRRLGR